MLVLIVWKALYIPFIDHSYNHCIQEMDEVPGNQQQISIKYKVYIFQKIQQQEKEKEKVIVRVLWISLPFLDVLTFAWNRNLFALFDRQRWCD